MTIGVDMIFMGFWRPFLVVVLNTQAKAAKLTTSTLQLSPALQKFPKKFDFFLC